LLEKILTRQDEIDLEIVGYKNKEKLRSMVVARAEKAAKHLKVKVKDICGYDSRLALNQVEFADWCKAEEGKLALKTGILGPRTAETRGIGAQVLMNGQVDADVSGISPELQDMCLKEKCKRHKDWATVHRDDSAFAYNLLSREKDKLAAKKNEIISEAETTEAMRPEYEDNITTVCF
jgi:COMPASS component SPP1